jgi:arginyl-tRNA synthetase
LRKGEDIEPSLGDDPLIDKEVALLRLLYEYPALIEEAALGFNPSLIANYLYELAKEFNQFYHDHSILSAGNPGLVSQRLMMVRATGQVIESGMELLGIEVPHRM